MGWSGWSGPGNGTLTPDEHATLPASAGLRAQLGDDYAKVVMVRHARVARPTTLDRVGCETGRRPDCAYGANPH
jgi:hypothetical protein